MTTTILNIEEIVSDPKIRGGRPVIRGTGLKVTDVFFAHTTGNKLSAEEIAEQYGVPLSGVYAALSYYYSHKAEIDEEIRRDYEESNQLIEKLERQGKLTRHE